MATISLSSALWHADFQSSALLRHSVSPLHKALYPIVSRVYRLEGVETHATRYINVASQEAFLVRSHTCVGAKCDGVDKFEPAFGRRVRSGNPGQSVRTFYPTCALINSRCRTLMRRYARDDSWNYIPLIDTLNWTPSYKEFICRL